MRRRVYCGSDGRRWFTGAAWFNDPWRRDIDTLPDSTKKQTRAHGRTDRTAARRDAQNRCDRLDRSGRLTEHQTQTRSIGPSNISADDESRVWCSSSNASVSPSAHTRVRVRYRSIIHPLISHYWGGQLQLVLQRRCRYPNGSCSAKSYKLITATHTAYSISQLAARWSARNVESNVDYSVMHRAERPKRACGRRCLIAVGYRYCIAFGSL